MRTRLLWAVQATACVALVAVSIPLYGGYFGGSSYRWWLGGALVLGALAGATAVIRPWRTWLIVLASAVALYGYLVLGLYRATDHPWVPHAHQAWAAISGLSRAIPRLLTTSTPADPLPNLLAMPVAVTWLGATAATILAIRTRAPLLPLLPGLVCLLGALALTANQRTSHMTVTAVWILLALVTVVIRSNAAGGTRRGNSAARHSGGRAVLGVIAIALIVGISVATAGLSRMANSDHRYDPRRLVSAPVKIADDVSPLSYVEGQRDGPRTTLFSLTLSGANAQAPADGRVRLAGLDDFTGATWTIGGRFQHASTTLPPGPKLVAATTTSEAVNEQLDSPFGAFIPALGQPVAVHGVDAYVDAATGQLLGTPVRGRPVMLRVSTAHYSAAELAYAVPDFTFDHSLPRPVPRELSDLAAQITASAATPYQRLGAILNYVKAMQYATNAPPGNAYYSLVNAVRKKVGNIEQHAALFVVLARLVGLPARIAVGYVLHAQPGDSLRYTVTTRDAYAWAEVPMVGRGWVSFDPISLKSVNISKPLKTEGEKNAGTTNNGGSRGRVDTSLRPPTPSQRSPWFVTVLVVLAAIVLVLAAIAIAKWLVRRRRRTTGSAEVRIVGAWRSMRDTLRECGVPIDRSLTAQEAADVVDARIGAEAAGSVYAIAPIVAAALYAPVAAGDEQAAQAWQHADALARMCRGRLPLWRRAIAAVDPRGLIRLPAGVRLPRWRRVPARVGAP